MNGYQLIISLSDKARAGLLGITEKEAKEIIKKSPDELKRCETICLEEMNMPNIKGNCREKLYCCYDCRKEFLDDEIKGVQDW